MAATLTPRPTPDGLAGLHTLADLVERLGDIPLDRVRLRPPPGTATERDLTALDAHENQACELVDGVLVEKAMGALESLLAMALGDYLRAFVRPRRLGFVLGPDGTLRLFPGLVRIPDVSFVSWQRAGDRRPPKDPIPDLAPDLAVEILSQGNTPKEMARKRQEYFAAGVRLLWIVDPGARTVTVFTGPDRSQTLDTTQTLDGGDVLPGFHLALSDFFAELDADEPGPNRG
jgi:Uma2 family endonuclease